MSDNTVQVLFDKQAIGEALARYCRSLDRMDKAMAYAVWHEDGTALYHDMYQGSGRGFIDWVWEAHAGAERHSHQITQSLIEVDGDRAVSETYVTVAIWTLPDENDRQTEIVGRGRYLDRWSRRDGCWAIDHREHVLDMQTLHELNKGYVNSQSTRDENDPSFALFNRGEKT